MQFVSPTENITLKIGPALISGALILANRPDYDTACRQFGAIVDRVRRRQGASAPAIPPGAGYRGR